MNVQVKNDKYIFDPSSRTITFIGLSSLFLSSIYAVFNTTDGICIYDFGDPQKTGYVTNNVLTLSYDTGAMSSTDSLLIKYDDGNILGVDTPMKIQDDNIALLRRIVKLLEASANADIGNRQRIVVDAITGGLTLATVSTVSTVTNPVPVGNVATVASYDQRQFQDPSRIAYNTGVRSQLKFT